MHANFLSLSFLSLFLSFSFFLSLFFLFVSFYVSLFVFLGYGWLLAGSFPIFLLDMMSNGGFRSGVIPILGVVRVEERQEEDQAGSARQPRELSLVAQSLAHLSMPGCSPVGGAGWAQEW